MKFKYFQTVLKWYMQRYMIIIVNYGLINRRQSVVLSGQCLSLVDMQAAVQKKSIVGPVLFLIYLTGLSNDLKRKYKSSDPQR